MHESKRAYSDIKVKAYSDTEVREYSGTKVRGIFRDGGIGGN